MRKIKQKFSEFILNCDSLSIIRNGRPLIAEIHTLLLKITEHICIVITEEHVLDGIQLKHRKTITK